MKRLGLVAAILMIASVPFWSQETVSAYASCDEALAKQLFTQGYLVDYHIKEELLIIKLTGISPHEPRRAVTHPTAYSPADLSRSF